MDCHTRIQCRRIGTDAVSDLNIHVFDVRRVSSGHRLKDRGAGANALNNCMNAGELRDYYGLLGIPHSATISDIHKAYWQQASRCHPDKGGSHEEMVQLVEAWKILSDPIKRSRYDQLFKYRNGGWRSRKFNNDVQDAQERAKGHSTRSWDEFEAIYQKAFYTFNQDFYGEDVEAKAAGPYSPLMGSKSREMQNAETLTGKPKVSARGPMFGYIMKTLILFIAIMAASLIYRNFSGVGRYVPLWHEGVSNQLILDTTTGDVYSVEKGRQTLFHMDGNRIALHQREKWTSKRPDHATHEW